MKIAAYVMSCPDREEIRLQTLLNLAATDWGEEPYVEIDDTSCVRRQERQEITARKTLEKACADAPDFILFLEDDLQFNRYLRHNLTHWAPLCETDPRSHFFASLYNPTVLALETHHDGAFFRAHPESVYGSQAFLLSLPTARYIVERWDEVPGMQDIKMSRLASRRCPIFYHAPSMVQHLGERSAWGGHYHMARDFAADWKAKERS
ncbi:MAG: hypothetical protein ABIN58_02645 [candidate division WOR-3 bacterium]